MNPLDPLQALGLLDKLVVEHGAAAIQKVHIELLRDVIKTLDTEGARLKIRVTELEREAGIARDTNQQLHVRNQELKNKLELTHSPSVPAIRLEEDEEKVLVALAKANCYISIKHIQRTFQISEVKAEYCVGVLLERDYAKSSGISLDDVETTYCIDHKGRQYALRNGLVK